MKNRTMMQYFEWYLPDNGAHWNRCAAQAAELKRAGIDMLWLPPAYKGAAGGSSVGYDVYDMYDLGEFDQKGSIRTKYGTAREYLQAVNALKKQGIKVLADIVLNHRMGADGTEAVMAEEGLSADRRQNAGGREQILAWTKFDFPGRAEKYSSFHWNASHFSGTDWDEGGKRNGIFRFEGKIWNRETDSENGNYDYLMGADLDTDCKEVVNEVTEWGKWYLNTVHMDGFRLDAVKHISFEFYREWLKRMREHAGADLFAVGEYWAKETEKLVHYLDVTKHSLSLFDVPLHFRFLTAATSDGNFDMRTLFSDTLTSIDSKHAVTFVDNHDTQPGQALYSFIPAWFKPIAYALILLRKEGIPCVFYGDYYGIPHDGVGAVNGIRQLIKIRQLFAYGKQNDYFDNPSMIGFTREGEEAYKDSGLAVVCTDSAGGTKRMYLGTKYQGMSCFDALCGIPGAVVIDQEGYGVFPVNGGSVSVWLTEPAWKRIYAEV